MKLFLGKDVLSERQNLSFNKVDKRALVFGATAAGKTWGKSFKKCALCDFKSDSPQRFDLHIRFHKELNSSDCLQCKECGMCFASEPSWKKHLFLLHRIKKPQLSDYCNDLKTPDAQVIINQLTYLVTFCIRKLT